MPRPRPVAAVHAGRELRASTRRGLALLLPARRFDPRQPGRGAAIHRARATAPATAAWRRRWSSTSAARLVQVRRLLQRVGSAASSARSASTGSCRCPNVVLPVGISFFTFQALSYVIDVYRGELEPSSLLDFAVYLSFFPHLVAGPIVRAVGVPAAAPRAGATPAASTPAAAFRLIVVGLFKKVVIASYLADRHRRPASSPSPTSTRRRRGARRRLRLRHPDLRRLLRLHRHRHRLGAAARLPLPAELRRPVHAPTSLQDFWRRWHMTLSRWLRDYLYIPLGGNRGGALADLPQPLLTMLLGGLWHGAAWTFVVWGALHGVALAVERWSGATGETAADRSPGAGAGASAGLRARSTRVPGLGVLPGRVLRSRLRPAGPAGRRHRLGSAVTPVVAARDRRHARRPVRPHRLRRPGPGRLLPLAVPALGRRPRRRPAHGRRPRPRRRPPVHLLPVLMDTETETVTATKRSTASVPRAPRATKAGYGTPAGRAIAGPRSSPSCSARCSARTGSWPRPNANRSAGATIGRWRPSSPSATSAT